jgi:hypothetical protein
VEARRSTATKRDLHLSDEEVKKTLLAQQPSEMLLKDALSSEVRPLERDLEKKMQLHLVAAVRSHLLDSDEVGPAAVCVERSVGQVHTKERLGGPEEWGGSSSALCLSSAEQALGNEISGLQSCWVGWRRCSTTTGDRVELER